MSKISDLLLRIGDAQAQRELGRGASRANLFQAGAGFVSGVQNRRAAQAQAQEDAFDRDLDRRSKFATIANTEDQIADRADRRRQEQEAREDAEKLVTFGNWLTEVASAQDLDVARAAYESRLPQLVQAGIIDPATDRIPERFPGMSFIHSRLMDPRIKNGLEAAKRWFPEPERGAVMGPGSQMRNPTTGELIAETPFKPDEGPTPGSFEDYIQAPPERRTEIEAARKGYMQADDRPRVTVQAGSGGLSPAMESNVLNRLTTQWTTATQPARELERQVRLMDAGIEAARRGDLAQGSQAVLVTFQKILDPTSVVRESEYARSASGLALDERVKGAFERLRSGGTGVPLHELEKFAQLAREAAQAQRGSYLDNVKERIGRTAERYRIPRELVFEDMGAPTAPPGGGPRQADPLGIR